MILGFHENLTFLNGFYSKLLENLYGAAKNESGVIFGHLIKSITNFPVVGKIWQNLREQTSKNSNFFSKKEMQWKICNIVLSPLLYTETRGEKICDGNCILSNEDFILAYYRSNYFIKNFPVIRQKLSSCLLKFTKLKSGFFIFGSFLSKPRSSFKKFVFSLVRQFLQNLNQAS